MAGEALAPIRRRYDTEDLRERTAKAGVEQTVLVQTVSDIAETEEFLATAADSEGLIAGVVGWVDLTADVAEQLGRLRSCPGGELLVGIRHQVENEPDPDWLQRPEVIRGLREIGVAGLVYDLLVRLDQLPAARAVAGKLVETAFILDHAAKPAIAAGETEPWTSEITAIAELDNVGCKLSGLVTEARWDDWNVEQLRPYAEHVLAAFSPDRVLFGSDWPVCDLATDYSGVVELASALVEGLSPEEKKAIFGTNAREIYALSS
jgi:L-fuconolactonase